MSSVDWDEVKRLAADFQRAQLSSSAQRLSERNCIEIIKGLTEKRFIDVIFTTDGKEYITPQHLLKEIKDELFVNGGRVNLVDVAKNLLVDLQVVTKRTADLEKSDSSLRVINGQLINKTYTNNLCNEINDKLQQQGQISVGDLTSQYDLPSEFLISHIEKQLGKTIHGIQDKQDRQLIFTPAFVERNLSLVRGALLAITRPLSTATLINLIGVPERIFFSAVDSLIERKEMPGVLTGKQKTGGSFVPYIYTKSQQDWVINFYNQNGYIEIESVSRLGISDPVGFIQKTLNKTNMIFLPTVVIGPVLLDQVEAALDEALTSSSFVKILQMVPTTFDAEDAEEMLKKLLTKKNSGQNAHVFNHTTVVSEQYIRALLKKYDGVVEELAKKYVKSGEYMKHLIEKTPNKGVAEEKVDLKADRKEERKKKASEGKSGGGTQGRETKTKSTKKKYMKGKQQQDDSDEDDDYSGKSVKKVEVVRREDVLSGLEGEELLQEEDDEELQNELVGHLLPILNAKGIEQAKVVFESTIASANQNRRKKHLELQEKLTDLIMNVKLCEKGLKQIENADVHSQLTKYLLKSLCTDIANEIFGFIGLRDGKDLTIEQRQRIAVEASAELKEVLNRLNRSLTGSSVEEFMAAADAALGPSGADIMVYKHDKKKERPQMLHQRELLIEQLNLTNDPALALHLSALIIFQAVTQTLIHASGKFVFNIISHLKDNLSPEDFDALKTYHDIVLQYLSNSENRGNLGNVLHEEMPRIKNIALASKKNSQKSKERTISTTSN